VRSTSWIILLLCAGCTAHVAPTLPSKVTARTVEASPRASAAPAVPTPSEVSPSAQSVPASEASAAARTAEALQASTTIPDGVTEGEEEAEADDDDEVADATDTDEGEAAQELDPSTVPNGPLYTTEWSDEQLTQLWKKEPTSLGSISVGFVESGRMMNSVRVPNGGEDWLVVSPELAYGTQETIDYLTTAIREVRAQYPKAPPLRVNQLSSREGGYLRPHKSHQNGRDVDLGFYYPTAEPIRARERERYIDVELNWALIKALTLHTDVQMILVDKRVQKVIYDFALSKGENKEWLDSLFNAGTKSIVKHAKRHRDHFHVRFFNPRAQELGRRVAPLLALQPDKNIVMHRVRSGNTLGAIALKYGTSINAIKKANRMRGVFLSIGQVLAIPLRGPCTRCPVPPPVIVPPRRLPPGLEQAPALAAKPAPAAPQAPVTLEVQPAVATQAPTASETQPAVATQQENTGGSTSPASPESAPEAHPRQAPEAPAQQPANLGSPANTQTSAALVPVLGLSKR
jgi:LysM repeat protein